jgi:hypothetical protein
MIERDRRFDVSGNQIKDRSSHHGFVNNFAASTSGTNLNIYSKIKAAQQNHAHSDRKQKLDQREA